MYGSFLQAVQQAYEEALSAAEERASAAVAEADDARFQMMQAQRFPQLGAMLWRGVEKEQLGKAKAREEQAAAVSSAEASVTARMSAEKEVAVASAIAKSVD